MIKTKRTTTVRQLQLLHVSCCAERSEKKGNPCCCHKQLANDEEDEDEQPDSFTPNAEPDLTVSVNNYFILAGFNKAKNWTF